MNASKVWNKYVTIISQRYRHGPKLAEYVRELPAIMAQYVSHIRLQNDWITLLHTSTLLDVVTKLYTKHIMTDIALSWKDILEQVLGIMMDEEQSHVTELTLQLLRDLYEMCPQLFMPTRNIRHVSFRLLPKSMPVTNKDFDQSFPLGHGDPLPSRIPMV